MSIWRSSCLSLVLLIAALPGTALAEGVVKLSEDGGCYCPGGENYERLPTVATYPSLMACREAGGHRPEEGLGKCPVPGEGGKDGKSSKKTSSKKDGKAGKLTVTCFGESGMALGSHERCGIGVSPRQPRGWHMPATPERYPGWSKTPGDGY